MADQNRSRPGSASIPDRQDQGQPGNHTIQYNTGQNLAPDSPEPDNITRMSGKILPNPIFHNDEFEGVLRAHNHEEHELIHDLAVDAIDLPPAPRIDRMARKYSVVHDLPGGFYSKNIYTKELCARIPGRWMVERLEAEKIIHHHAGATSVTRDYTMAGESREWKSYALEFNGRHIGNTKQNDCPYLILGIFSRADNVPTERRVEIHSPEYLFATLSWNIMRLRGLEYWLSLKEVKQFGLYKVLTI